MKSLFRIKFIFISFSIVYASETKLEPINDSQLTKKLDQDKQTIQSELKPVDIKKMNTLRIGKAKAERIHAATILNKHKNPKVITSSLSSHQEEFAKNKKIQQMILQNQRQGNVFEKSTVSIREKYNTVILPNKNGKRGITFSKNSEYK